MQRIKTPSVDAQQRKVLDSDPVSPAPMRLYAARAAIFSGKPHLWPLPGRTWVSGYSWGQWATCASSQTAPFPSDSASAKAWVWRACRSRNLRSSETIPINDLQWHVQPKEMNEYQAIGILQLNNWHKFTKQQALLYVRPTTACILYIYIHVQANIHCRSKCCSENQFHTNALNIMTSKLTTTSIIYVYIM